MTTSAGRARAGSFGAAAEQYDRARPTYPSALLDDLVSGPGLRVLDVGCGTGIAGRQFVRRGCEVSGVEHDPRMAAVARQTGMQVEVARFEDWTPSATDTFDLVISGQAWHWIDPLLGPLKAADVLGPGGRLAVFWIEYRHTPEVREAFEASYRSLAPELLSTSHPLGVSGAGAQADMAQEFVSAIERTCRYGSPVVRTYIAERTYATEQWIDELPTHSDHQLLPESDLVALLAAVRTNLDQLGGEITVELKTCLVRAQVSG